MQAGRLTNTRTLEEETEEAGKGGRERISTMHGAKDVNQLVVIVSHSPLLVAVDQSGSGGPDVGAGADSQQNDQQEGLKVEESRLVKRDKHVNTQSVMTWDI